MPILKLPLLYFIFLGLLIIYSLFSFSLTDPNLVLLNWSPYWQFQQFMWSHFFNQPAVLTTTYAVIIAGLFFVFFMLLRSLKLTQYVSLAPGKKELQAYSIIILVLFFSYNALSHDVFNYIFNAKMLVVYHANPHQDVALSFSNDLWTRFMHNTHTPAPYGYGWTAISLFPYFLGFGKFITTWLAFRLFSVLSIYLLYLGLQKLSQQIQGRALSVYELAIVFLNPLFLIEVVSNMHNDLWMMSAAVWSLLFLLKARPSKEKYLSRILLAFGLLLASISIKFSTLVLLPLFLVLGVERKLVLDIVSSKLKFLPLSKFIVDWLLTRVEKLWLKYLPLLCSMLLFVPLFLPRSQQFHPWYLLWSLIWLPFIKTSWWKTLLLWFSISSLARYIPWLWVGNFEGHVVLWQQFITWVPVLVLLFLYVFINKNATESLVSN